MTYPLPTNIDATDHAGLDIDDHEAFHDTIHSTSNYLRYGSGTPEGNMAASVGTIYMDINSGAPWYKDTGASTTGWVEIQAASPAYKHWFDAVEDLGLDDTGTSDNASAFNSWIAGTYTTGDVVYFPSGTYLMDEVDLPSGITLVGQSRKSAIIKAVGTPVESSLINVGSNSDIFIKSLGFDGDLETTIRGIEGNGAHDITIDDCYFFDFRQSASNSAAVWFWQTTGGIVIKSSEFFDNIRSVVLDDVQEVRVFDNHIWGTTPSEVGIAGVTVRLGTPDPPNDAYVNIYGNHISDQFNTAGGEGDGHGINVFGHTGVMIHGNTIENCGRGVLVGDHAHGATVANNRVRTCNEGIRFDLEIGATDVTIGTGGVERGGQVIGNTVSHSVSELGASHGITVSYAAGCLIMGNTVYECDGTGVHAGASDRAKIIGNISINNWQVETDPDGQGGIQINNLDDAIIIGNTCFDNQTTPTQEYGLVLEGSSTNALIRDNDFRNNSVGEINDLTKVAPEQIATEENSAYTLSPLDRLVNIDTSGGAVVVTLTDNATDSGHSFVIRRDGASTVTINRAGTDTFDDGNTQKTLDSDGAAIGLFSIGDGEWKIVGTEGTVGGS